MANQPPREIFFSPNNQPELHTGPVLLYSGPLLDQLPSTGLLEHDVRGQLDAMPELASSYQAWLKGEIEAVRQLPEGAHDELRLLHAAQTGDFMRDQHDKIVGVLAMVQARSSALLSRYDPNHLTATARTVTRLNEIFRAIEEHSYPIIHINEIWGLLHDRQIYDRNLPRVKFSDPYPNEEGLRTILMGAFMGRLYHVMRQYISDGDLKDKASVNRFLGEINRQFGSENVDRTALLDALRTASDALFLPE